MLIVYKQKTDIEIYMEEAVKKRDNGELSSWEACFIDALGCFKKKDLIKLKKREPGLYLKLREIAGF